MHEYCLLTRDVKILIKELEEEGVEGIIVDLRNNGGGSLQEANELTGPDSFEIEKFV